MSRWNEPTHLPPPRSLPTLDTGNEDEPFDRWRDENPDEWDEQIRDTFERMEKEKK